MAEENECPDALKTWLWNSPAIPEWLGLVGVDFEAGDAWWERLLAAGFDKHEPEGVTLAGVSTYLTKDAIAATRPA
jgi:O-methyltransferase involved in polyketide biosynthesis